MKYLDSAQESDLAHFLEMEKLSEIKPPLKDLLFIHLARKSCKFLGSVMNALTKWMLQK